MVLPHKKRKSIENDLRYNHVLPELRAFLEDSDTSSDESRGFNHNAKGTFRKQNSLATVNEIAEDSTSVLHDRDIKGHGQPGIEQKKITKTGLLSPETNHRSPKKRTKITGMGKSGGQRALSNLLQTRIQESYHDKANRQRHTPPKDVRTSEDDMYRSGNDESVDSSIEIHTCMSHPSSTERLILNVKTSNEKIATTSTIITAEEANLGDTTESDTDAMSALPQEKDMITTEDNIPHPSWPTTGALEFDHDVCVRYGEHIKKYSKRSPVETNSPFGLSNYQGAVELFLKERSSRSETTAMEKNSPNPKSAITNDGKASRRVTDGGSSKKKRKKNGSSQKETRKQPKHSFTKDPPPALEDEGYHPAMKPVQNDETCEPYLSGFNNHHHGEHSNHEKAFLPTHSFVREGNEKGKHRQRNIANTEAIALNKENVVPNTPDNKKHMFDRRIASGGETVCKDNTVCVTMKNGKEDQYLLPSSRQVAKISSVDDVANLGVNWIQQKDRKAIPADFEKELQVDCQQDCSSIACSKSSR
eukprot:scaffold174273_cov62-Attheya_sp.AAC.1